MPDEGWIGYGWGGYERWLETRNEELWDECVTSYNKTPSVSS